MSRFLSIGGFTQLEGGLFQSPFVTPAPLPTIPEIILVSTSTAPQQQQQQQSIVINQPGLVPVSAPTPAPAPAPITVPLSGNSGFPLIIGDTPQGGTSFQLFGPPAPALTQPTQAVASAGPALVELSERAFRTGIAQGGSPATGFADCPPGFDTRIEPCDECARPRRRCNCRGF